MSFPTRAARAKAQNELMNEANKLSKELAISFDRAMSLARDMNRQLAIIADAS